MTKNSSFEKAGSIKTCPACGEILKPLSLKCEACGHDVNVAKNLQSVDDFYKSLNRITDINKRIQIISDYPVPTSKDDIIQFLAICFSHAKVLTRDQEFEIYQYNNNQRNNSLLSNFGLSGSPPSTNICQLEIVKKEYDIWTIKKDEVLIKARAYHYKDVEFIGIIDRMNSEYLLGNKNLRRGLSRPVRLVLFLIVIFIAIFIFIIFSEQKEKNELNQEFEKLNKIEEDVRIDIINKKYDEALILTEQLIWTWKPSHPDSKKKAEQYDAKRKSLKETIEKIKASLNNEKFSSEGTPGLYQSFKKFCAKQNPPLTPDADIGNIGIYTAGGLEYVWDGSTFIINK